MEIMPHGGLGAGMSHQGGDGVEVAAATGCVTVELPAEPGGILEIGGCER